MSVKTFSINNTDVANAYVNLKVDSLIWQIYSNFFQCNGLVKNAGFNTVFLFAYNRSSVFSSKKKC